MSKDEILSWLKLLVPTGIIIFGVHTSLQTNMAVYGERQSIIIERQDEQGETINSVREEVIRQGSKQMVLEARVDNLSANLRAMED